MARGEEHPLMDWRPMVQLMLTTTKGGTRMAVTVGQYEDRWYAMALETPLASATADDVLSNHAHEALGTFANLGPAMETAEDYVRSWRRGKKAPAACPCDAIESKSPPAPLRRTGRSPREGASVSTPPADPLAAWVKDSEARAELRDAEARAKTTPMRTKTAKPKRARA